MLDQRRRRHRQHGVGRRRAGHDQPRRVRRRQGRRSSPSPRPPRSTTPTAASASTSSPRARSSPTTSSAPVRKRNAWPAASVPMGRIGTTDEVADVGAVAVLRPVVVRHRRDDPDRRRPARRDTSHRRCTARARAWHRPPVRRVRHSTQEGATMTTTPNRSATSAPRWVDAELAADVDTLDALVTDDFRLVGPFGFVLDKQQWLDRYRSGDFTTTTLDMARRRRPRVRRQRRHDRHPVPRSGLQGLAVERRLPHHPRVRPRTATNGRSPACNSARRRDVERHRRTGRARSPRRPPVRRSAPARPVWPARPTRRAWPGRGTARSGIGPCSSATVALSGSSIEALHEVEPGGVDPRLEIRRRPAMPSRSSSRSGRGAGSRTACAATGWAASRFFSAVVRPVASRKPIIPAERGRLTRVTT